MTGDTALQLIALGATFVLGMWSGRAWALAQQHVNGVLGSGLRAVDVNDAAEAAEDEPELPYRPAADPYRFTYDTALRDLKPAVPPTAQVAGEPEPPPATTGLPFGDQLSKYPN